MITIYGMDTCPDCTYVKEQIRGKETEYNYVDIGSHARLLKEFLRIRDKSSVFDEAKEQGYAGIPCFVLEDGTVTLHPEEAGLKANDRTDVVQACSLEDHRAGKKGC